MLGNILNYILELDFGGQGVACRQLMIESDLNAAANRGKQSARRLDHPNNRFRHSDNLDGVCERMLQLMTRSAVDLPSSS